MSTAILLDTEDVARGQLDASLSAAGLSIVLNAGEGAEFPQPLTGGCSSLGSSTALNDTGALGSLAVGDFIRNVTDGSWAYVTSIAGAPNAVVTTPLIGGTDNTWDNADVWRHGEFIVTLIKTADGTATGAVTQRERVLISDRSTDTLTVPSGGRGFDGTTGQSFAPDDFVNLYITAVTFDYIREAIYNFRAYVNTIKDSIDTSILALQDDTPTWLGTITGTNTLTGTASPAQTAYLAGQRFAFIVANTCSGAVTLNVNSLGAKNLYKPTAAALASGDITANGLVECRYDGTQFVMTSPLHGAAASLKDVDEVFKSAATSTTLTNPTSATAFDTHTYQIPANDLVAAVWYEYYCVVTVTFGTAGKYQTGVGFASALKMVNSGSASGSNTCIMHGIISGTAAAGASAEVRIGVASHMPEVLASCGYYAGNQATNGALDIKFYGYFETSNGGNNCQMVFSRITKHSTTAF